MGKSKKKIEKKKQNAEKFLKGEAISTRLDLHLWKRYLKCSFKILRIKKHLTDGIPLIFQDKKV